MKNTKNIIILSLVSALIIILVLIVSFLKTVLSDPSVNRSTEKSYIDVQEIRKK